MQQIEALLDIQIATSLMGSTEFSETFNHYTDVNYKSLNCNLTPLNKYAKEYSLLKKYIDVGYDPENLGYHIQLLNIFKIERSGERDRFDPYRETRPRKLLWHGSRLCNSVGILSEGLRIAPPEAPMSGYLFGKGIYLADRIQKSAPFCFPSSENNIGILYLCDTALGEHYEVKKPEYIKALPSELLSTKVLGKNLPDPTEEALIDDKVIIPLGSPIPTNELDVFVEDQEFVVYNVSQVQLKYLVLVQFDFI